MKFTEIAFVDFEASSLSINSYPIEYGYAYVNKENQEYKLVSKSNLIYPLEEWDDWDLKSEEIHKIPRMDLLEYGVSLQIVANDLLTLKDYLCISDNPNYDNFWLNRLYDAGNIPTQKRIKLYGFYELFNFLDTTKLKIFSYHYENSNITRHRAENDAKIMAKALARAFGIVYV